MKAIITPSKLSGTIQAPPSKSAMQRACAAALLHKGETVISNPGKSADDKAALSVIKTLGADVKSTSDEKLLITRTQPAAGPLELNCGESGLSLRMFAPIAALRTEETILTGTGSLLSRPMNFFDELFPRLGVAIASNNGHLPLTLKGPLHPQDITIDGSLSSQFLTGLLFAFAASNNKPATITVSNLKSRPYIDLTLQMMKLFGYKIENNNYLSFTIYPGADKKNSTINYTVEGDWSGAAFLLVAGAIAGPITVTGLEKSSTQADKAILNALNSAGAILTANKTGIISAPAQLRGFKFDATDCPDLFPPLAALAAHCKGTSVIEGAGRLKHKESDRGSTLQSEFGKLGINISVEDDTMLIEGGTLAGGVVSSCHDHRIAMACAVAGLKAGKATEIENAEAVNKSYPEFFMHLEQLKAGVKTI